jgi:hypothetical protein
MLIYFPNKTSMECFISEVKANEFMQREGGHLISVPAFESKDDAEKWIQELDSPNWWHVSFFENSILIDNHGKPLEVQTTKRNPGEPIARSRSLEKPDFIYCVEPG